MTLHIHRGRVGNGQNTNKNQDAIDGFAPVTQVSFSKLSFEHIPFTAGHPLEAVRKVQVLTRTWLQDYQSYEK